MLIEELSSKEKPYCCTKRLRCEVLSFYSSHILQRLFSLLLASPYFPLLLQHSGLQTTTLFQAQAGPVAIITTPSAQTLGAQDITINTAQAGRADTLNLRPVHGQQEDIAYRTAHRVGPVNTNMILAVAGFRADILAQRA